MCVESIPFLGVLLFCLLLASVVAITLASLCRQLTVEALQGIPRFATKARQIERHLRTTAVAIAAIVVTLKLLAYL